MTHAKFLRNVSHDTDFQEIRQVEASTKFREPSILDEESMSFGRRNNDAGDDDLSDLLGSKKVLHWYYTSTISINLLYRFKNSSS